MFFSLQKSLTTFSVILGSDYINTYAFTILDECKKWNLNVEYRTFVYSGHFFVSLTSGPPKQFQVSTIFYKQVELSSIVLKYSKIFQVVKELYNIYIISGVLYRIILIDFLKILHLISSPLSSTGR